MAATQFAEGELDLKTGEWFCMDHSVRMKVGKDCPWCMYETLTPAEFEKWAKGQS
jgi:hypothetical protein